MTVNVKYTREQRELVLKEAKDTGNMRFLAEGRCMSKVSAMVGLAFGFFEQSFVSVFFRSKTILCQRHSKKEVP